VHFVVDRKDLDYQTMGNPHEYKINVTTIQKLDTFIKGGY